MKNERFSITLKIFEYIVTGSSKINLIVTISWQPWVLLWRKDALCVESSRSETRLNPWNLDLWNKTGFWQVSMLCHRILHEASTYNSLGCNSRSLKPISLSSKISYLFEYWQKVRKMLQNHFVIAITKCTLRKCRDKCYKMLQNCQRRNVS